MDTHQINLLLVILGGLLLFFELASGILKIRLFLSEPIIALFGGIIAGPYVLNLLDIYTWGSALILLEEIARLTLAVTLIGIAFALPNSFLKNNKRDIAILLGIVLPIMWLSSGLLVYFVFGLPIWVALLAGAVLAPTDPVVSNAIVTGDAAERNIPRGLRNLISAESAANDALTFPFVMIPILFLDLPPMHAIKDLLLSTILWETLGSIALGAGLGWISGKILLWTESRPHVERHSLVAVTLSLALAVLGMVKLLHMDGILAVFIAGVTLNLVIGTTFKPGPERIEEVVKRFIDLPIFFLFGLAAPWENWISFGWAAVLLPAAILLLRRLPSILLFRPWIGQIKFSRDALFAGWFGPIGVAAIYYATYATRQTGHQEIWTISSLVIFSSLVIYGITDMPFTLLYGKYARSRKRGSLTDQDKVRV